MKKIFFCCLLTIMIFGCNQSNKNNNKQSAENEEIKTEEEISTNCNCSSDLEISTPQFADNKNSIIICFDDIRNYYDEFESYFFKIYNCKDDSVIFDKNYGPDKCLLKVNDSTIIVTIQDYFCKSTKMFY